MQTYTIYIAGPMSGLPDANRAAFRAAEALLRRRGVTNILSPANQPDGLPYCSYMIHALGLLSRADAILMLAGFGESAGAKFELEVAQRDGKEIYYLAQGDEIIQIPEGALA